MIQRYKYNFDTNQFELVYEGPIRLSDYMDFPIKPHYKARAYNVS